MGSEMYEEVYDAERQPIEGVKETEVKDQLRKPRPHEQRARTYNHIDIDTLLLRSHLPRLHPPLPRNTFHTIDLARGVYCVRFHHPLL